LVILALTQLASRREAAEIVIGNTLYGHEKAMFAAIHGDVRRFTG